MISGWLTGIYFVVELGIGLWTGSIAVISDAFHTFSAVGGVLVAIVSARIAKRPADDQHTFGWYRAEVVGALANGAFLLVMAIVVIVMGAMRLGKPIPLETGPMLIAAAGGLITEFISLYLLFRQQRQDINVRGAYWHIIQTFVGSLIIVVAALVIRYTGFLAIDPILGIAFGFVLLWASWGILRDASRILMDGTPEEISISEVSGSLSKLEGVVNVHHLHAWVLTSGKYICTGHLRVDVVGPKDQSKILKRAQALLREEYGFFFSTIQIETEFLDETGAETIDLKVS